MKMDQSFDVVEVLQVSSTAILYSSRYGMNILPCVKTIQKLCCENPAKVINLKSKGTLDLNKDADFTLIKESDSTSVIEESSLLPHQRLLI